MRWKLRCERDGVGREQYALESRFFLGAEVDLEDTYRWGFEELARIEADMAATAQRIVPGGSVDDAVPAPSFAFQPVGCARHCAFSGPARLCDMIPPASSDETIFAGAFGRPAAERRAYLDAACAADPAARVRVEALLRAIVEADGFMEVSATAEWEFVQKTHWLKRDTTAANVSRSPTVHPDGPRITWCVSSDHGRPKNSLR